MESTFNLKNVDIVEIITYNVDVIAKEVKVMLQKNLEDVKQRGAQFCENVIQNIPDTPSNEDIVKMVTDISKMFSDIYKKKTVISCEVKTQRCSKKGE